MAYDAVLFLERLFARTLSILDAGETETGRKDMRSTRPFRPDDLPGDWRVEWEERAAIREYGGGQAREHAEAEAFREILARMQAMGDLPAL